MEHHAGHAARRCPYPERELGETPSEPPKRKPQHSLGCADEEEQKSTADSERPPPNRRRPPVPSNSAVQRYGNLPQTTGSAVLYHPELKVFKRPEFLPDPRRRSQLVERRDSIRETRWEA